MPADAPTYVRDLTVRDWEAVADLDEKQQNISLIARCYGLTLDAVRDLPLKVFRRCASEVAERNDLG